VHEGGSYVNRGIFSDRWDAMISAGLEGKRPTHPLLDPNAKPRAPAAETNRDAEKSAARARSSLLFPKTTPKSDHA
jgi:hypothetical protein